AAAPPPSHLVPYTTLFRSPAPGLSEIPPVSKVMPLPTRATDFLAFLGFQLKRTRRGPRAEPWPTDKMPPKPCFLSWNPKKAKKRSEEHTSELQSRFDLVCR